MINLKPFNNFLEDLYKDFDISKFDKLYLLFELLLSFYENDIDFTSFVEDYMEKNNLDDSINNQLDLIGILSTRYNTLKDEYRVRYIEDCYDFELDQDSQVHYILTFNDKLYKIYLVGVYDREDMLIYIDEVKQEIVITYKVIGEDMNRGINSLESFNKYIN